MSCLEHGVLATERQDTNNKSYLEKVCVEEGFERGGGDVTNMVGEDTSRHGVGERGETADCSMTWGWRETKDCMNREL